MTPAFDHFLATLNHDTPPADVVPLARAVWFGLRGNWDAAHDLAQADDRRSAAWVHAWLHRIEGDTSNALYWYRRAGQTAAKGSVREEGLAIAAALLADDAHA